MLYLWLDLGNDDAAAGWYGAMQCTPILYSVHEDAKDGIIRYLLKGNMISI